VKEDDGSVLLTAKIVTDDIYQRQGENIITWTEPPADGKDAYDLALSFQDESGCRETWLVVMLVAIAAVIIIGVTIMWRHKHVEIVNVGNV